MCLNLTSLARQHRFQLISTPLRIRSDFEYVLKLLSFIILILIVISFPAVLQETYAANLGGVITPTDIYYLTKSIDDSLVAMYGLTYQFDKKRLSDNIRPRNSYQKLLSLADEFNLLHNRVLDQAKLDEARRIDVVNTRPADLYRVLVLMKDYLDSQGTYTEHTGSRDSKTPSDVTHMLRQISYHHIEIAKQKNIATNWSTPPQVFDAIMQDILPTIYMIGKEAGYLHNLYDFPMQPVKGIVPRNITKLIQCIYANITGYYAKKGKYDPLVLITVNDCDDITPSDSFDLVKVVSAELKAMSGSNDLDAETAKRYAKWKAAKTTIAPGDVYRLLEHSYILSKRILEKSNNSKDM